MSTKHDTKSVGDEVETALVDAESTKDRVLRELREKATAFQGKAVEFQHEATDYVKDKYAKAKDKSTEVGNKVTDYARENPLKTIGISLAVGAILAKLIRSRK